jgi:hypothetical protein
MSDLLGALKALRGFTLYEKYVILVVIAMWMDRYLKSQADIEWANEQLTRMERELGVCPNTSVCPPPPSPSPSH